jgi:hypothetical protein
MRWTGIGTPAPVHGALCTVHWLKDETLTVTAVGPMIGSFEVMVLGPQAKDRLPVTVRGTLL